MDYKSYIASIPGFPKEGIIFRDVTTLLQNGEAFKASVEDFSAWAKSLNADVVVGPESRGFIFGAPVATALGIGFVPIRKPGKLPRKVITADYALEYGTNTLCLHADAIKKGQKVVIIDDLIATGGTTKAAIQLIEQLGGEVVGCGFVVELTDLKGRDVLKGYNVYSLCSYEGE